VLFSIITPSCKQLDWLRLCVASVRDQVEENAEKLKFWNGFRPSAARLTNWQERPRQW